MHSSLKILPPSHPVRSSPPSLSADYPGEPYFYKDKSTLSCHPVSRRMIRETGTGGIHSLNSNSYFPCAVHGRNPGAHANILKDKQEAYTNWSPGPLPSHFNLFGTSSNQDSHALSTWLHIPLKSCSPLLSHL